MRAPDIELRLPADCAYVAVLRTTTAGLAARLNFTLEAIEDGRMSVGEAASIVLEAAARASDLHAAFWLDPGHLRLVISVSTDRPFTPDTGSFAWTVLTTLAEATWSAEGERFSITIEVGSTLGGQPPA